MLCVIFGIVTGVIFYDSQAVLSFENGEFSGVCLSLWAEF